MISKIKRLKLPIIVYGSGNDPNAIIEWGKLYYSKKNATDFVLKEFTLYFPKSPLSITRCKTMSYNDVFADDWSLFVSNDNKTFYNIIRNHTICDSSNYNNLSYKIMCNKSVILNHDATKIDNYYYFVKFVMTTNTYYERNYKDLIAFDGFELYGNFLHIYNHCTRKDCKEHNFFLFMILLFLEA